MEYYTVKWVNTPNKLVCISNNLLDAKKICYFYMLKNNASNEYFITKYITNNSIVTQQLEPIYLNINWSKFRDDIKMFEENDNITICDEKIQKIINYLIELDDYNDKLNEKLNEERKKFKNENKLPTYN